MARIERPHAAVPYAATGGGGPNPPAGLVEDPPGSGLFDPDSSDEE